MRYKVQVINVATGVNYYTGPAITYENKGTYPLGTTFIASDSYISSDNSIWFKNEKTGYWSIYRSKNVALLKVVVDLEDYGMTMERSVSSVTTNTQDKAGYLPGQSSVKNPTKIYAQSVIHTPTTTVNASKTRAITLDKITPDKLSHAPLEQNQNIYPMLAGNDDKRYIYNYSISFQDMEEDIRAIRRTVNDPTMYTIHQLNYLMHNQFNRYKINYADYERGPMLPFVFFTRPDLNIYDDDGKILGMYAANPSLQFLVRSNPEIARSLTLGFTSDHDFIPYLSNRVYSLDVIDESVDVAETGETFTGYKMQYAKHSIKSMTAGSLNIKFPESYNLSSTIIHQLWVGYESAVYRGYLEPKKEYITGKILDYACDIYYFLCDRDMTIRFWSKYYGCFPSVVPKSIFSYDMGSLVQFPETNITYNYFYKEDFSPDTFTELNANSHVNATSTSVSTYMKDFIAEIGQSGTTWVGAPFVEEVIRDDGQGKIPMYVLRFKPAPRIL